MGALEAFGGGATSLEISLVMAASLPSAPQNSRQAVSSSHLAERMALDATASGFLTAKPRDRPGWCPCVRDSRSLPASAVFRPKTPTRKRLGALLAGLSLCVCGYNQKRFQSIHARWGAVLFSASSLAAFAALTNQFSEKGATVRMPGTERTMTTKRDRMPWGERVRRYAVCLVGIFCISFGVALFTKSGTGTSAISVIPYTLSLVLPQLSYGTWVALFNMAMALAQPAMLRRDTDWLNIVQQLFFATVFGSIVDFSMWILTYCNPVAYWQSFILMLLSIPTLAMGAYLTLISRVGVMAGDGFTLTISQVTGKEFALIRVISDSTMTAIAVVMCLVFWGSLVTVREGTICAALFTGAVVGWYKRHLKGFEYALLPTNREQDQDVQTPSEVPSQILWSPSAASTAAAGARWAASSPASSASPSMTRRLSTVLRQKRGLPTSTSSVTSSAWRARRARPSIAFTRGLCRIPRCPRSRGSSLPSSALSGSWRRPGAASLWGGLPTTSCLLTQIGWTSL